MLGTEAVMSPTQATVAQRRQELEQVVLAHWTPEVFRRFQCVWLTYVLDLPAATIAEALDLHVSTVRRIRTEFAQEGFRAIDGKGNRGGRRNQYLSFEEETAFLLQHVELFNKEGFGDIRALKEAFEVRVGRMIHKTTLYRLLERHGRKGISIDTSRSGGEPAVAAPRRKGGRRRKPGRLR